MLSFDLRLFVMAALFADGFNDDYEPIGVARLHFGGADGAAAADVKPMPADIRVTVSPLWENCEVKEQPELDFQIGCLIFQVRATICDVWQRL